jgi:hypothetical protein|tara:strand:+ start:397 stop:498 length:102 start_codon:yes stop_codon:yes gene_type:complete
VIELKAAGRLIKEGKEQPKEKKEYVQLQLFTSN